MIKKIKSYISNFAENSDIEDNIDTNNLEILNLACAALLIETAFVDKNFSKEEILSMKITLKKVYHMEDKIIDSLILPVEDLPLEEIIKKNITINYCALVNKN